MGSPDYLFAMEEMSRTTLVSFPPSSSQPSTSTTRKVDVDLGISWAFAVFPLLVVRGVMTRVEVV